MPTKSIRVYDDIIKSFEETVESYRDLLERVQRESTVAQTLQHMQKEIPSFVNFDHINNNNNAANTDKVAQGQSQSAPDIVVRLQQAMAEKMEAQLLLASQHAKQMQDLIQNANIELDAVMSSISGEYKEQYNLTARIVVERRRGLVKYNDVCAKEVRRLRALKSELLETAMEG